MSLKEVTVIWNADTKQFEASAKQAESKTESLAGQLGNLGPILAGAFGAYEFKEFIGDQIEIGSQINDMSEKLGIGSDDLQELQYAAKLTGVEFGQAGDAIKFLNKNLGAAQNGNKDAIKTFKELGIEVTNADGSARPMMDVVGDLAEGLKKIPNQGQRTVAAMKLMGRSGANMLPMLQGGSDGIKAMGDEFRKLGGPMSEEFVQNSDEAGDNIDKLKVQFQNVKSVIANAVLPTLIKLTEWLQPILTKFIQLSKSTNVIEVALRSLAAGGFLKAVMAAGKFIGSLEKVKAMVSAAGGGWKAWLSVGPELLAIVAAVVAIGLVVEDLYTLFTGGNSAIAAWLDELMGVGTAQEMVDAVAYAFYDVLDAIDTLKPALEEVWAFVQPYLKPIGEVILAGIVTMVKATVLNVKILIATFKDLWAISDQGFRKLANTGIGKKLLGAVGIDSVDPNSTAKGGDWAGVEESGKGLIDGVMTSGSKIFGDFGEAGKQADANKQALVNSREDAQVEAYLQNEAGFAASGMVSPNIQVNRPDVPMASMTANPALEAKPPVNQKMQVTQTFNISGATDPKAVGAAVSSASTDALQSQIDTANASLAGGT